MKIQKGGGPKGPREIARSAPSVAIEWEPFFESMREFERSMMRRFSEFFSPWAVDFKESTLFEMRETEQGFIVSAAMPGFDESEIEVRIEPWRLYLHAKHEESTEKEGERVFQQHREFTRWIDFPAEVNPEKANAVLARGVLEVTLEKAQSARKVQVRSKAA
jgi:HSP20 family molecular chaperone IbpA